MADVGDDVELGEILLILAAVGIGGYFLYKGWQSVSAYFSSAMDVSKVGSVPGITGATQVQVQAAATSATKLQTGGQIIWTDSSNTNNYDYLQPGGQTVTQVRESTLGKIWPWADPVTYTDVPYSSYVRPSGGVSPSVYIPTSASGSGATVADASDSGAGNETDGGSGGGF